MEALGAIGAINISTGTDTSGKSLYDRVKHKWWSLMGRSSCKILFECCTEVQLYKLILVLDEQSFGTKRKHVHLYTCGDREFYAPTRSFTMSLYGCVVYPLRNANDIIGYEFWSKKPWRFGLWGLIEQIYNHRNRSRIHPTHCSSGSELSYQSSESK